MCKSKYTECLDSHNLYLDKWPVLPIERIQPSCGSSENLGHVVPRGSDYTFQTQPGATLAGFQTNSVKPGKSPESDGLMSLCGSEGYERNR